MECKCGCGATVNNGKQFITGHNLRVAIRTKDHNIRIGNAQKKAWADGRRKKAVVGEKRIKNGKTQIRTKSTKGWLYWKNEPRKLPSTLEDFQKLHSNQRHKLRKKGIKIPYFYGQHLIGRKQSKEHIENRRKSQRKYLFDVRTLDKEAKERVRKSLEYRQWRDAVFAKDNWTCTKCGQRNGNGVEVYIEAHHIKPYTKYPDLRFNVNNGITLCKKCHKLINSRQMKGNKHGRKRLVS